MINNKLKIEHLNKIIDILYNAMISEGGDGDAYWYCRYYPIEDILPLVEDYNAKLPHKCPMRVEMRGKKTILWHWEGEESCILITTDEDQYKKFPEWSQMIIRY